MGTRTIRRTSVTLPSLDELDPYLSHLTSVGDGARVAEFRYEDAELRALDLTGTHLIDGRVTGISSRQTRLDELRVDSVEFTGCDLASLRWTDSKITRSVFRDCKLLGAALDDITLDDVCFDNCKLDYSTLTRLRATGPVIFTRCSLREITFDACDLSTAAFDNCDLRENPPNSPTAQLRTVPCHPLGSGDRTRGGRRPCGRSDPGSVRGSGPRLPGSGCGSGSLTAG